MIERARIMRLAAEARGWHCGNGAPRRKAALSIAAMSGFALSVLSCSVDPPISLRVDRSASATEERCLGCYLVVGIRPGLVYAALLSGICRRRLSPPV